MKVDLRYVLLRFVEFLGEVLCRRFAGDLDKRCLFTVARQVARRLTNTVVIVSLDQEVCEKQIWDGDWKRWTDRFIVTAAWQTKHQTVEMHQNKPRRRDPRDMRDTTDILISNRETAAVRGRHVMLCHERARDWTSIRKQATEMKALKGMSW